MRNTLEPIWENSSTSLWLLLTAIEEIIVWGYIWNYLFPLYKNKYDQKLFTITVGVGNYSIDIFDLFALFSFSSCPFPFAFTISFLVARSSSSTELSLSRSKQNLIKLKSTWEVLLRSKGFYLIWWGRKSFFSANQESVEDCNCSLPNTSQRGNLQDPRNYSLCS